MHPHPAKNSAFTLIEVMVALGIFFIGVFAILGVMNNSLANARALQRTTVDIGRPAVELVLTNTVEEGMKSGDFGNDYPGYTWTRDIYEAGTNGLYEAIIVVQKPSGAVESEMSIYLYKPNSQRGQRAPVFRR